MNLKYKYTKITLLLLSTFLSVVFFYSFYTYNYKLSDVLFRNSNTETSTNSTSTDTSIENIEKNINQEFSESGKYIRADLQTMKVKTYLDGVMLSEYDIVSKGKPQSYYETPAGEFTIKEKNKTRFSSMGHVYMPYAMQFYGNFFIHGIPYYPDGKRVSTSYSGGCIRIGDEDMKEIYEFAEKGTKIIVINKKSEPINSENIDPKTAENMAAILFSLEIMNQEKYVNFNGKQVQVKELNHYIAKGNVGAKNIVQNFLGKSDYQKYTKERMYSIGIQDYNNETFINDPEALNIFVTYIKDNKNFVLRYL